MADFAATNGLSINIAYLARQDRQRLAAARATRIALLERGIAEPETFYVVEDGDLWKKLTRVPATMLKYGTIDGLRVIMPGGAVGLAAIPLAGCGG